MGTSTISIIEVVWTTVAAVGLALSTFSLWAATGLKADPDITGLEHELAALLLRGDRRNELQRFFTLLLFVVAGLLVMITRNESPTFYPPTLGVMLIAAEALVVRNTLLDIIDSKKKVDLAKDIISRDEKIAREPAARTEGDVARVRADEAR